MTILRDEVKSASQIAFLGSATPNLRALTVSIFLKKLRFNFYYENAPTENEIILCQSVSKRTFLELNNVSVSEQQIIFPQPEPIPLKKGDQWIYCRKEGNLSLFKIKTFFKELTLSSLRAASQFALLGSVTNNLRAVTIMYTEKKLRMNFYYDREPDFYEAASSESVLTSVLWSIEGTTGKLERFLIPEHEQIPFQNDSIIVYLRYENSL